MSYFLEDCSFNIFLGTYYTLPVPSIHEPLLLPFIRLQDSILVQGVAFKKAFSYAGFEMQQKKYENPKIAMLNVELELKAERENAEVRVDNVQVSHIAVKNYTNGGVNSSNRSCVF